MSSLRDRLCARFEHVERYEKELHDYQRFAIDFLIKTPYAALFIDTGLGKTVIVLTLIAQAVLEDIDSKVLVIAPVRVAAQGWPNEIAAWDHTAWLGYTVIRAEDDDPEVISAGEAAAAVERERLEGLPFGDLLKEIGEFDTTRQYITRRTISARSKAATAKKEELRLQRMRENTNVHLINREQLTWLIDQYSEWKVVKRGKKLKKVRKVVGWPYRTVVIDESSGFKDQNTKRFKALFAVRKQGFIDRLIELTATPAAESYMGLFSQIALLDEGQRLGKFITHYREANFDYNQYARTYKLKDGAKERIGDKIADLCLVMESRDYLEEQEPLFLPRWITMEPAQLAEYKRFERDFIYTLPSGQEIEAGTAAALAGKLIQLASGSIYDETGKTHYVHDHKLTDLTELFEEIQESPILVSYWYKSSLTRLRKAFPFAKEVDKAGKIVSRHGPWNTGKVKMLLVHPASVGHGLNMQYGPGHDLYMYDQCWSYELFYQLYRRLHRQGQKKQVRVHLPQVRDTYEPLVVERLKQKEDAQQFLFNRIRQARKRMTERDALRMAA